MIPQDWLCGIGTVMSRFRALPGPPETLTALYINDLQAIRDGHDCCLCRGKLVQTASVPCSMTSALRSEA